MEIKKMVCVCVYTYIFFNFFHRKMHFAFVVTGLKCPFSFFFGLTLGMWKFPGANLSHSFNLSHCSLLHSLLCQGRNSLSQAIWLLPPYFRKANQDCVTVQASITLSDPCSPSSVLVSK